MSDLLEAAAAAMNVPATLVERSAQARADESGSSLEEVLTAWSGGGSVSTAAPATEEAVPEAPAEKPVPEAEAPEPTEAPAAPVAVPETAPAQPAPTPEPDEELEPVALGRRIAVASRIGAVTGALLGIIGFLAASPWLFPLASVASAGEGEETSFSPAVDVAVTPTIVGVILFSIVFGVIVAVFARTATGWTSRSMTLTSRPIPTILLGAGLGALLGAGAGGLMTAAFGTPIENAEGFVTMGIIPSLIVLLVGGAVLGAIVAAAVEALGVPGAISETEAEEVSAVRKRLGWAVGIPVVGILILALLVLPIAFVLIRSESLTTGGAAVIAIFIAGGVLGFSSLSASRPNMRVTFGEVLAAIAGIATVVLIAFSVLSAQAPPVAEQEAGAGEQGGTEGGEGAVTSGPATAGPVTSGPATTAAG